MKTSKLFLFLFCTAVFFISCQKDGPAGNAGTTGPAGPAGPAGANGTNGTNGSTGATGATGATGTANVIYSVWFTSGTWTNTGTPNAFFTKAAPGITQIIIDRGVVLAYAKLSSDGSNVRPLPATPGTTIFNYFIAGVGNLQFTNSKLDGSNVNPSATNQFRYVIIPGGVAGRGNSTEKMAELDGLLYTENQLKAMSYSQVCSLLKIAE